MGRKSISGQEEAYIQEEKSFIEINTHSNTEAQNVNVIPGTNLIDTRMSTQTMEHNKEQISRSNSIISINEVIPKADTRIKAAQKQKT